MEIENAKAAAAEEEPEEIVHPPLPTDKDALEDITTTTSYIYILSEGTRGKELHSR